MKKTFVNPEMNISLFDMENVVTASGTPDAAPTNMEAATTAIGTVSAVSDIEWIF
jgi:hypothetical protein